MMEECRFLMLLWIPVLEYVYRELIALDSITTVPQLNLTSIIGFLRNMLSIAKLISESCELSNFNHHLQLQVALDHTGLVGRPCISDFTETTNISH